MHLTNSEYFSIIAILISLSAILISYFTYRREKKKANQDILFQEKLLAFKEISFLANKLHFDFYSLVEVVQDFEGNEKEWEEKFDKISNQYYEQAFDFQNLLSKYMILFPNKIYLKIEEFAMNSVQFVTSSSHGENEITINSHDKLENQLHNIIDLIRSDLNVDKLNIELSKRIK